MKRDDLLSLVERVDPKRKLNEEQIAAILSDRNTVVSAGAGSGKTTVLSIRFLRLVAESLAYPDQILTLTFTRKASLEMNSRIKALVSRAPSIPDEVKARMGDAVIATLDSFLTRIVRLDCTRYGIARDFTIEDGSDRRDRVRRLASAFMEDPANSREMEALSSIYTPQTLIDDFFMTLDAHIVLASDYRAVDVDEWMRSRLKDEMASVREACLDCLTHLESARSEANRNLAASLVDVVSDGRVVEVDAKFNARSVAGDDRAWIDKWRTVFPRYQAIASALCVEGVDVLQTALEKFSRLVFDEKRRSACLTFSDVSSLAIDILVRNTAVRRHFKSAFRYIMIDEFQDNNSLQRDLLFLLAERSDLMCEGRIPHVDELEGDKLFFVGDEKQSIYLFRGADVSVFRALQDEIASSGGVTLNLSTNYRSSADLIRHFNGVFESVFQDASRAYEARFEETRAGRGGDDGSITLLCGDRNVLRSADDGLAADEKEAWAVADLVSRMLSGDDFLIDGRRPAAGDIAILFAKTSYQVSFEIALKRRGIPFQTTVVKSLMQQAMSSDFYCLLQSLVHPDDALALASVLRGPFARISDGGIIALINGDDGQSLDQEDAKHYQSYLAFANEVRLRCFSTSLASLVSYIFYEGGYYAYLQTRSDWQGYEEHFEYLLAYALSYDSRQLSLTDYLAFLRDNLASRSKLDEVAHLHLKRQGVQMMTIHASKGLEFPIVILASCGLRDNPVSRSNVFEYEGHLVATTSRDLGRFLDAERRDREAAEARRLLYVGMTRAERHLVVSGLYAVKKDGGLDERGGVFFNSYLRAVGFDPLGGCCRMGEVEVLEIPSTILEDSYERPVSHLEELEREASEHVEQAFSCRIRTAKPSGEDGFIEDGTPLASIPSDALAPDSALFGTAVHAYIELSLKGNDVEGAFMHPMFSGAGASVYRKDVASLASSFLSSNLWSALKGRPFYSEYRFFSYSDAEDVVYEGVVDLLVDLGDRMLVVDYKSDRTWSAERHKTQVVRYLSAMEEVFHKPCIGTLFYLRGGFDQVYWNSEGKEVDFQM